MIIVATKMFMKFMSRCSSAMAPNIQTPPTSSGRNASNAGRSRRKSAQRIPSTSRTPSAAATTASRRTRLRSAVLITFTPVSVTFGPSSRASS